MDEKDTKAPEGKKFYGSVTVSERGQIVIPVEARRDFNIQAGDKLVILGDPGQGIGIMTGDMLQRLISNSAHLFSILTSSIGGEPGDKNETTGEAER